MMRPSSSRSLTVALLGSLIVGCGGGGGGDGGGGIQTAPAVPSDVAYDAGPHDSLDAVTVTWSDNSTNESGFQVERGYAGTYTTCCTAAADETSCTCAGNTPWLIYYFRVRAMNPTVNSDYANLDDFVCIAGAGPAGYTLVAREDEQATVTNPMTTVDLAYGGKDSFVYLCNVPSGTQISFWCDNTVSDLGWGSFACPGPDGDPAEGVFKAGYARPHAAGCVTTTY